MATTVTTGRRPKRRLPGGGDLSFSVYRIAGYVFFLALWQFLSSNVLNEVTLPRPLTVFERMGEIIGDNELWPNVRYTMTTFLIIFALAFPLGPTGAAQQPTSGGEGAEFGFEGTHVLAVDDEPGILLDLGSDVEHDGGCEKITRGD